MLAVLHVAAAPHQLKVVDDEEIQAVLGFHAPGLGARLEHGERRAVVDEDLGLAQASGGGGQSSPVRSAEIARPHRLRVDLGLRAEHALDELGRRHLEAEDENVAAQVHPDVLRNVQREGRLSHARASGDDDEVRGLEARGLEVELLEARGHAGHVLLALVEALDVLERVLEDPADGQRAAFQSPLGEAEDPSLGVVDEPLHVLLGLERLGDDLGRRLDQLAKHRHVPDDVGIGAEVRGDRGLLHEQGQRCRPAHEVDLAAAAQLLAKGDHVDGLTPVEEDLHRREDGPVGFGIEVGGAEELDEPRQRLTALEEHGPEHRALGVEIVRGNTGGNFQGAHGRESPSSIRDDRRALPHLSSTKFVSVSNFVDMSWTSGGETTENPWIRR